jgi:glycerol-3-phosphate acyltransferase PlsY
VNAVNVLLLAVSYLLGATPASYWVGKAFHGIDLREHGSGNLGATNALRVLGWKWAVPVIVVDVAKGYLPVRFLPGVSDASFGWTLAFGAAAILGHMFSLWVGFRGGKGVATSGGVFLGLAPWAVLGAFAVWAALLAVTRYVSVASMGAALALPALVAFTQHAGGGALLGFTAALTLVVLWAHRANVRRLVRGEEHRIGGRGAPEPAP